MINLMLGMTSVHRKGVTIMKNTIKMLFVTILVIGAVGLLTPMQANATSTTKKLTLDLNGDYATVKRPSGLNKTRKVVVKSSKKSVAQVKYSKKKGDKRVTITGKKVGKATITVKCYYKKKKTKTYKYKVSVVRKKKKTALEKGKEAFQLQNKYRKENGIAQLQWSDEIYEFCMYRMKTSGYDKHKYIFRDTGDFFGDFGRKQKILFAENMTVDTCAKDAINSWKNSKGHRNNMLSSSHLCGAIGTYKDMWFAIFWDKDAKLLNNWRDMKLKKVTVKRYDTASGSAIVGSTIGYYEKENRNNTMQSTVISKTEGENLYLEIGKTYVIYERIRPDGYEKAESVTITVTEAGPKEVILSSTPGFS